MKVVIDGLVLGLGVTVDKVDNYIAARLTVRRRYIEL